MYTKKYDIKLTIYSWFIFLYTPQCCWMLDSDWLTKILRCAMILHRFVNSIFHITLPHQLFPYSQWTKNPRNWQSKQIWLTIGQWQKWQTIDRHPLAQTETRTQKFVVSTACNW